MANEIRSIFVEIPAEEARRRWERSGAATAELLLAPDLRPVDLHFIPADGGCVIAAVPRHRAARRGRCPRLPALLKGLRPPSVNLEALARQLLEEPAPVLPSPRLL